MGPAALRLSGRCWIRNRGSIRRCRSSSSSGTSSRIITTQPSEIELVRSLARLGVTTRGGFDPGALRAEATAELARGFRDATAIVRAKSLNLGVNVNGWTINYQGPRFGTDWLLRAGVVLDQRNVTVPEEALYPLGRVDSDGAALDGANAYRIHFAPGRLPPVGGFWSITIYDDAGRLVANPIDRYAIGDPDARSGDQPRRLVGHLHRRHATRVRPVQLAPRARGALLSHAAALHPGAADPRRHVEAAGDRPRLTAGERRVLVHGRPPARAAPAAVASASGKVCTRAWTRPVSASLNAAARSARVPPKVWIMVTSRSARSRCRSRRSNTDVPRRTP